MEQHLRCSELVSFYGIYSSVFIVETDMMTQWPATREGGAAMFGASAWLNGGSERDKTAESCQPWEGEENSHRSGARPQGRIRGHRGQKAISNDG